MRVLKQSTAYNLMVFMTLANDHIQGATGLTLTVTASKNGAAFSSISPTVTERGNGWYNLALTASHTDTNGDLALHITAANADASDVLCRVVAYDYGDINLSNAVPTSNTAHTIGDALNAARAQGFGKWVLDTGNDTLTLYASDGSTVVRTFTLDSSTAPTTRT